MSSLPIIDLSSGSLPLISGGPPSAGRLKGTYAFVSLGCPKNLVDSEKMLGSLAQDGYELVSDPARADFVIVNTCGFIESSRAESRSVIQEMLDNHEIDLDPYYHAFSDKRYLGDFRFVLIDEEITQENELPILDNIVLNAYGKMKFLAGRPEKWFGLDESMVTKELVPVVIKRTKDVKLTRIK